MLDDLFCSQCIRVATTRNFSVWLILALGAAIGCLYASHKNFKHSRLIADMPTSRVRSASQGFTELIGVAILKEAPLHAPLTAKECLWWHYEIERYQSSGKSSRWVTLEKGTSEAPFYFRDSTGECRIEPKGAEISCRHKGLWYGSTRRPTGQPKSYQGGFSLSISGTGFGHRYRYTEQLILDGDPLYALGHFNTDNTGGRVANLSKITGDILRSWKQDFPALLKKFDTDKDSELNRAEWNTVQDAAKLAAKNQQVVRSSQPAQHSLVLPEQSGLPFIIGSAEQETLTVRFRRKALVQAVGFLAAGSISTWLISARFF